MRTPAAARPTRQRAFRRIWLPQGAYEALPLVYCGLGATALASGLFLPHPAWALPYLLLLAVTCIHAGIGCYLLRCRYRLGRLRRERQARRAGAGAFPGHAAM